MNTPEEIARPVVLSDLDWEENSGRWNIACFRGSFVLSNLLGLAIAGISVFGLGKSVIRSLRIGTYSLPLSYAFAFGTCRYLRYDKLRKEERNQMLVEAHEILVTDADKKRMRELVNQFGDLEGIKIALKEKYQRMHAPSDE